MAKRSEGRGLGRSFYDIMGDNVLEGKSNAGQSIRLSDIEPRGDQPRKTFDREALEVLADSIANYGVLQPIIYDKTAIIAPPALATKSLSVVMTVNYVAVVACPFVVDFAEHIILHHKEQSFPFVLGAALVALVALLSILLRKSFVLGLDESYYK